MNKIDFPIEAFCSLKPSQHLMEPREVRLRWRCSFDHILVLKKMTKTKEEPIKDKNEKSEGKLYIKLKMLLF